MSVFVVLLSAILAYSRGLIHELLAITSWVLSVSLATILAPLVSLTWVMGLTGLSFNVAFGAIFFALFFVFMIINSIFINLIQGFRFFSVDDSEYYRFDQELGGFFGLMRGVLLILIGHVLFIDSDTPISELSQVTLISLSVMYDASQYLQQFLLPPA